MNRIVITFVLLLFGWAAEAQVSDAFGSQPAQAPLANVLFDYLNVAGGQTAANFKPLTQRVWFVISPEKQGENRTSFNAALIVSWHKGG